MADSSVAVTPGAGADIDSRTAPDGHHRQVVVLGDPDTAGTAKIGAEGGLYVTPRGGVRFSIAQVTEAFAVPATTEALLPVSRSRDRAAAVTTAYVVPAGWNFRLQAIYASLTLVGTVAHATRIRLHANPAGAATTGSAVQASWRMGNWSVGTQAANYTQQSESFSIPDGFEFAAGTGLALGAFCTAASMHSLDVTMIGYEYPA